MKRTLVAAFLASLAFTPASAAWAQAAAQSYPAKPVRMIVPYVPGGVTDVAARLVGGKLADGFGQSVVVENRPGAGGTIGAELGAKAPADGYTLLMATSGEMAITPAMQTGVRYDTLRDFTPVLLVSVTPLVIVAHADAPFATLKELIAAAKAKPDAFSYATPGAGGAHHVTGEWLKHLTGIRIVHVPYKGGAQAAADVAGGQAPIGIVAITPALPHIKSGKVRVIAVTSAKRSSLAPDWPTVIESGFAGFDTSIWVGLFAPAGTPAPIVARLNAETNRVLALAEIREKFAVQGGEPGGGSQEEFASFIRAEIAKYRKIIQDAGIKGE